MQSRNKILATFARPVRPIFVPRIFFISLSLSSCLIVFMLLTILSPSQHAHAQEYNVLQECMELSDDDNDINNCVDNYLDLMDDNIRDISEYIANDLSDAPLDQFQLSQQAFFEYREQNCLWYLEISSPRDVAEKIAKNCLAQMSQQRLAELQLLIATDQGKADTLRGFYVYGANRNSFQPCGSEQRYWVEGDNTQVGQLQTDYLSQATADLQVMSVVLRGQLDTTQDYPEHDGVLQLTAITSIKPPSDSDCSLPQGAKGSSLATAADVEPVVEPELEPEPAPVVNEEEPEQVLRAYFGAWLAECKQNKARYTCELMVEFSGSVVDEQSRPTLLMSRNANKSSLLYLKFPNREVDNPAKIRWSVDNNALGDIVGSQIRVDEVGTQQLVQEQNYIRSDLMPLLLKGTELNVEVLADVDDNSGDNFTASLNGLTRALGFADDFVTSGGKL